MNELDFHKQLLQDPQNLDDEMLAFLGAQPQHQKSLKQARDLDKKISEALDIEVPEGLEARILLNQSYQEIPKVSDELHDKVVELAPTKSSGLLSLFGQSWPYSLGGLAASLLVAVMVFGLWQNPLHSPRALSGDAMVAHILEHIEEDPNLMLPQALAHSPQELNDLFAAVGARLDGQLETMSYAGECVVEGQRGLHIVMQDETGPVTVIVMPGPQIEAMQAFNKSGYTGELIPVKGGLVAIVGNSMEQLALAHMRFFSAVKFV